MIHDEMPSGNSGLSVKISTGFALTYVESQFVSSLVATNVAQQQAEVWLKESSSFAVTNDKMLSQTLVSHSKYPVVSCLLKFFLEQWSLLKTIQGFQAYTC